MDRFTFACVFLVIAGFCNQVSTGEKPTMYPENEEVHVTEGDELRIECSSEQREIQFSFPEDTFLTPRSRYEISGPSDNGKYTFVRRTADVLDSGWYACAEKGIKIINNFKNLNHTHQNISWIYVYVDFDFLIFLDRNHNFPIAIIAAAGSNVFVPCRLSDPEIKPKLWQKFELVDLDKWVKYDPKIGFIMEPRAVAFEDGEAYLRCENHGQEDIYILRLLNATGPKPTMILPSNKSEQIIQEGEELRIECSGETKIGFLFPDIKSSSPNSSRQSEYKIIPNENGTSTFLRPRATSHDTGWYGCAVEGIENDIPYHSIYYTRTEISWIYVYVNSTVPIAPGVLIFGRSWSDNSESLGSAVIPCRPTSPDRRIALKHLDPEPGKRMDIYAKFEPKLGFVLYSASPSYSVFNCETDESTSYVSENYTIDFERILPTAIATEFYSYGSEFGVEPVVRMAGEELSMVCEAAAPEVVPFRLEGPDLSETARDRVQIIRTKTKRLETDQLYWTRIKVVMTITNFTESDSFIPYRCIAQRSRNYEDDEYLSLHVEVFDRNGSRYMKLGEQGGRVQVVGRSYDTVYWLVNREDFPTAIIKWYDQSGGEIIPSTVSHDAKYAAIPSTTGVPRTLYSISYLDLSDHGVHQLRTVIGNRSVHVNVTVDVQGFPRTTIWRIAQRYFDPGETVNAFCNASGFPMPNVTWSFLKCQKFPSKEGSIPVDLKNSYSHDVSESKIQSNVTWIMEMSGILTCKACNNIGCADYSTKTLYAFVSREPYFTSTSLNRSSITLNLETHENTTQEFDCYVGGNPLPTVTWFKDNTPLKESNRHYFEDDNCKLIIKRFTEDDGGKYMCRAINKVDKIETWIDLKFEDEQNTKNAPDTILIVIAVTLVVLVVLCCLVIYRLRILASRKRLINEAFKGGVQDRSNQQSTVGQSELPPKDLKWEYPRELLTLGNILDWPAVVRLGMSGTRRH